MHRKKRKPANGWHTLHDATFTKSWETGWTEGVRGIFGCDRMCVYGFLGINNA